MRASLAGALIGYVFGKIFYLPFSPISYFLGSHLLPFPLHRYIVEGLKEWFGFLPAFLQTALESNLYLFFGGSMVGLFLGILSFFLTRWLLRFHANRRIKKRKKRQVLRQRG
jgi:uncharacterized membrane protein YdjX (TVP38/TMEM64 family)